MKIELKPIIQSRIRHIIHFFLLSVSERVTVFNSVQNTEEILLTVQHFSVFAFLNKNTCNYESALMCFSTKGNLLAISGKSDCLKAYTFPSPLHFIKTRNKKQYASTQTGTQIYICMINKTDPYFLTNLFFFLSCLFRKEHKASNKK